MFAVKLILGLSFLGCIIISCDKSQPKTELHKLTYEDFRDNLTKDMDYQSIVVKFGSPDRDIGSGIHIYVWELEDSTELWIGYVDKILYARHLDKNRNVLHTLF